MLCKTLRISEKAAKLAKKLSLTESFFFHGAPTVILIISKSVSNTTLAAMSMDLIAATQELGTVYL